MKNEQQDQKNQGQSSKQSTGNRIQPDDMQQQKSMQAGPGKTPDHHSQGNEKSNISVNNDGKIGKAHDQWNNGNQANQQYDQEGQSKGGTQQGNMQGNNTTGNAGSQNAGKTDKKMPASESNKNSK